MKKKSKLLKTMNLSTNAECSINTIHFFFRFVFLSGKPGGLEIFKEGGGTLFGSGLNKKRKKYQQGRGRGTMGYDALQIK